MPANVEIVRKEMIKPSSPTPHHLKELKLSFLDQMAPTVYIPLIFFYEANQIKDSCDQMLKNSLSIALSHYYPLAGRTTADNYYIDCNDAGALFVEAKVVDSDFLQFIENPDMDDMKQLLHLNPIGSNIGDEVILTVQMNLFGCGGIAIAVQMCHKIADGNSVVNFMYAWAAICRGDVQLIMNPPRFDAASFFPPIDLSTILHLKPTMSFAKEKIVTKRLVFDKEKLEILKAASVSATANGGSYCPTRVEVVSAIIWKQLMEVKKHKIGSKTLLALVHAVNLRPRMHPSLPDCAFGNIITHTVALPMNEGVNEYQGL